MQRYWLLTWTTYGTWLPGDPRGFVGRVRIADGIRDEANQFQAEPHRASQPLLANSVQTLKQTPVRLNYSQADLLLQQFRETANYRRWIIAAGAVMSNHIHLVVGVPDDPEPSTLLRDFKSYGSRVLNRTTDIPAGHKWWTEHGSTRKLADETALSNAIAYVMQQEFPLVVWTDQEWIRTNLPNRIDELNQENHRGDLRPPARQG